MTDLAGGVSAVQPKHRIPISAWWHGHRRMQASVLPAIGGGDSQDRSGHRTVSAS